MSGVRVARAGAVTTLTLARADMHNALVPALLTDLLAALTAVAADVDCRAVILAADGPAFSIGGDMRAFRAARDGNLADYAAGLVGQLNAAILAIIDLPQPVIASVHGLVTGGSIGLVLAADQVLLAPEALFKSHYVSAGFAPDGGWTVLVPRLIGAQRAAAALLQNRTLRASEALAWGLAAEIVADGPVGARAAALATHLAAQPVGTVRAAKRLLWRDRDAIAAALAAEHQAFLGLIDSAEAIAGVDDFLTRFTDYPHPEPTP